MITAARRQPDDLELLLKEVVRLQGCSIHSYYTIERRSRDGTQIVVRPCQGRFCDQEQYAYPDEIITLPVKLQLRKG